MVLRSAALSSLRVRIDEDRNTSHVRTLPILTLKEREERWYSRDDYVRMKKFPGNFPYKTARCLSLAYQVCCKGTNGGEAKMRLSQKEVDAIRECLETDNCIGFEQYLIESIRAINNDKQVRRDKLTKLVVSPHCSSSMDVDVLRDKCNQISKPGEYFAFVIGKAQEQMNEKEARGRKTYRRSVLSNR